MGLGAGVVGMGGSAAETDPRWRLSNWSALSGSPMSGAAGPALPTGQQLLMPPPPLDSQGRPLAVVLHGPVAVAYPHLPTQGTRIQPHPRTHPTPVRSLLHASCFGAATLRMARGFMERDEGLTGRVWGDKGVGGWGRAKGLCVLREKAWNCYVVRGLKQ